VTWIPKYGKNFEQAPAAEGNSVSVLTERGEVGRYVGASWCSSITLTGGISMLVWLAVILLVAWVLGWGVFHVAGGLIHLLLVIALVVFLINFISGRRTV
jgi:hypothetical protein